MKKKKKSQKRSTLKRRLPSPPQAEKHPQAQKLSGELIKKLSKVQMLILDCDGILTDGTIWLDSNLQWRRSFNVRDGVGLKLLMDSGYKVGVITGGRSEDLRVRMDFLGIQFLAEGAAEKTAPFRNMLEQAGLKPSQVAYMGDEIYDVPIMDQVGFSATVPSAVPQARSSAVYLTHFDGGAGAVREVCDLILNFGAFCSNIEE